MAKSSSKIKKGLLKQLRETFEDLEECENVDLKESYRLPGKKIRVPIHQYPIQLNLSPDGRVLHLYPEIPLSGSLGGDEVASYILFDPARYYSSISGFVRLDDGDRLVVGPKEADRLALLGISPPPTTRQLTILNRRGELVFKNHSGKSGSCISPLTSDKKVNRIAKWRFEKLKRLKKIYGGAIKCLSDQKALTLIKAVNKLMQKEAYRPLDKNGNPGGVLSLPKKMNPILVGDLHAKPNNLLVVLSQNGFLEALEAGDACLIILGDAVHREDAGHYEEMESSLLIMDLIFKLKLNFPEQVFYLRGNHDCFSEDIGKAGVPQGLLWNKKILKSRGKEYKREMERFYQQLPYVAYSKNFVTCHAAPPVSSVDLDRLININVTKEAKLYRELICNRLRKPHRPGGYSKRDIKRFRKLLGVNPETPVVVGHTPLSLDASYWERAGDIDNHYIIYGSHDQWICAMTLVENRLSPLLYPVEPLISLLDSSSD